MPQLIRLIRQNPVPAVILLFCLLDFILESINGRLWMNDFRVYYSAAEEMIAGHDIYGKAYGLGTGFYKYSPFVALLFIPFAILPFTIAKTILFLISSVSAVLLFARLRLLIEINTRIKNTRKINIILFIVFASCLTHLVRELHLGNVNMILLFLLFSALLLMKINKINAGILIAFCTLVKPHFIILLPLLIFRKKFKTLFSFFASIFVGLLIPALFIGWEKNILFLNQWLEAMKQHSTVLENAKQTLASIIQNTFFFPDLSEQLYFKIEISVLIIFILIMAWFIIRNLQKENKLEKGPSSISNRNFNSEFLLLIALVPSLTITDTEHFLLSIPLITLLVANFFNSTTNKKLFLPFLILSLFLYGANWHDLLGSSLSEWFFENGLLGIGNVFLIILFILTEKRAISTI